MPTPKIDSPANQIAIQSTMEDTYNKVLKEAEQEAKKAARQQMRVEEIQAAAEEKRRQAQLLGDKIAQEKERRRGIAEVKFKATTLREPQIFSNEAKCLDHYQGCVLKNEWISYPPGNPRWRVPDSYPVPQHPEQSLGSNNTCPLCVAKLWAKIYQETQVAE